MKSGMIVSALVLVVAQVALGAEFRSGEVLVKFKSGIRARTTSDLLYQAAGVKSIRRFSGVEQLVLADNVKVEDAIAALVKSGQVEYAQPNYIIRIQPMHTANSQLIGALSSEPCTIGRWWPIGCDDGSTPNTPTDRPALAAAPEEPATAVVDPSLDETWGMKTIGAIEAWKTFAGDKKFIVADIDTGIDYNHEDLSLNVWRNPTPSDKNDIVGYDFIHDDGLPFDDQGHGTHTAGTIGAVGNNGIGVSGVNQRVALMAVKFLSADGSGDSAGAVKAIDYAIDHGAKVLNNSWGGPGDSTNQVILDAVNRAQAKGVLFVAAAGNGDMMGVGQNNDDPSTASYPAGFTTDNMIAVAATNASDELTSFSNFGAKSVHLAAPGNDVYSTLPGNKYGKESGTSMACPHVAGAAALLWAANPTWDFKKVKSVLMSSTDKLPGLTDKTVSGGRLNILSALRTTE